MGVLIVKEDHRIEPIRIDKIRLFNGYCELEEVGAGYVKIFNGSLVQLENFLLKDSTVVARY